MKKKIGGVFSILLAFVMTFAMVVPTSMMQAYAANDTASCELKVTKVLEGGTLEANQFEFKIEAVTEGAPMPEKATAKNDAQGNVSFGNATYTKAGTYEYKVTELKGNDTNIKYDTSEKDLKVTVTESSSGGNGAFIPTVHVGEGKAMQWLTQYPANGEIVNYNKGAGLGGACTYKTITDGDNVFHAFCLVEEASSGTDNGQDKKARFKSNASNGVGGTLIDSVLQIQNKLNPGVAPSMDKVHAGLAMLFYAGYPYNKANLKGNMSDQDYYKVTQWALWGFMHSLQSGQASTQRNSSGNIEVYDKLLEYANGGNGTNNLWLPESEYTMYVYWPSGNGNPEVYQPMISAYLQTDVAETSLSAKATTAEFKNKVSTPDDSDKSALKTTVSCDGKSGSADAAAEVKVPAGGAVKDVTDKIDYTGLKKDATYKVSGSLWEVKDGKVVGDSAVATVTEEKKAEAADGTWEITFKNVKLEPGKSYVVFEEATPVKDAEGKEITDGETIEHKNPEDKAQTVVVTEKEDGGDDSGDKPYLQTEAKNTYISPAKNQAITDEVEYGGLKNGEDYVIVGVLKNKSTGETVSSECKPVKIEDASESGVELMDFSKIDASGFQDGDQIVVFEYLYKGTTPGTPGDGTEVAKHADINDEAQTVTVVDGEISLLKTTDVDDAKVGDVIPYEITVSSTRDVTSVVNLEDYLGDNLEFVSASDGGELIGEDTQTVLWSSLEVPANGSATVTIKAKIKNGSGKSVVNEAYVADDYNIDNPMGNDDDSAVLGVYESSKNNNGTSTSKTKGAKTGDATKIALFVVVLILAAALTATMIVRRRRSGR